MLLWGPAGAGALPSTPAPTPTPTPTPTPPPSPTPAEEAKQKAVHAKAQKEIQSKHNTTLSLLKAQLARADSRKQDALSLFNNASKVLQDAEKKSTDLLLLPANVAYGKLPEMAASQGFLKLQAGHDHEQDAFIKFPTTTLRGTDTIIEAHLHLFKYGGFGGPAVVKLASCQWSRNEITFTNSRALSGQRVSVGITSKFPDEQEQWVSIKLKAELLQNARVAGDHLCFEVLGGPAVSALVISSEMQNAQAPKLELTMFESRSPLSYGNAAGSGALKAKAGVDVCKERLQQEITIQLTKNRLAAVQDKAKTNLMNSKVQQQGDAKAAAAAAAADLQAKLAKDAADEIAKQRTEIVETEQAKMERALQASDLTGPALAAEEERLKAQTKDNIAKRSKTAAAMVDNQIKARMAAAEGKIQAKASQQEAEIEKTSSEIQQHTNTLTAAQEAELQNQINTEFAKKVSVCTTGKTLPAGQVASNIDADKGVQMLND